LSDVDDQAADRLLELVRELKVGGTYWAAQPDLPDGACAILRVRDSGLRGEALSALDRSVPVVTWTERDWPNSREHGETVQIVGPCDPWHLLDRASVFITDTDDELALIAMLNGVGVQLIGEAAMADPATLRARVRRSVSLNYRNPFTGESMDFEAAARLCGFWRGLIDSNRGLSAAVGFALWKRRTVAPLLWGGSGEVEFASKPSLSGREGQIAVWKSRAKAAALGQLERSGARLIEVEDGFIRSVGLGSDCVPPLSIVVDRLGIYFDPARPSELERLLQEGHFPSDLLQRARRLREVIVERGITKYSVAGGEPAGKRGGGKPCLLAVGQVEDDRAILEGAGPRTNMELLRQVRERNPDAHIVYKPHPDVEAGHRRGAVPDDLCLTLADEIVRDVPISSVIDSSDEVHVNSSLAGFEALLRGKPVTTYGVPFYAGWGLSRDLGPVPQRRSAHRTIDEMVAAALILYPRYIDPVTGLPCPAEIQVSRLSDAGSQPKAGAIVQLRRLQGRLSRAVAGRSS
jgi:capsular polysaccharide export protein